MKLQEHIKRWKPWLRKVPGFGIARFLYRVVRGTDTRHVALLSLRPPKGLFQPHIYTSYNRYPEIFQFVQKQIGERADLRILSVGCSTGEEVFSLRSYFPQAAIVGLDINPFNIAVCRFRLFKSGDRGIRFSVAGSTAAQASASYDAVFAMAVFRHGDLNISPPPPKCDHLIRFSDFETSVVDLARILKPSGLLCIQHAMFRFEDTPAAAGFRTVLTAKSDRATPVYGSENTLLSVENSIGVVFQKVS